MFPKNIFLSMLHELFIIFCYMCLMWTEYSQKCHHEHCYTYISHYWAMDFSKCLSHCIFVSHCITTVVYIVYSTAYLSKTSKPVNFELSSNIHMYYAYGIHIYSSVATHVFLVWHTYFVFCIYANNFGNPTQKGPWSVTLTTSNIFHW